MDFLGSFLPRCCPFVAPSGLISPTLTVKSGLEVNDDPELTLSLSLGDGVDGPVAGAGADGGQTAGVHQAEGHSTGNYNAQSNVVVDIKMSFL